MYLDNIYNNLKYILFGDLIKISHSQIFAFKFELLSNYDNMDYGLTGGKRHETKNFIPAIFFQVCIFGCHTSGKDKDQIMNDLEGETNNYES